MSPYLPPSLSIYYQIYIYNLVEDMATYMQHICIYTVRMYAYNCVGWMYYI